MLYLGVATDFAKAIGLIAATIFAYFVNRFWTFQGHAGAGNRFFAFLALYASAVAINVGANHVVLTLFDHARQGYPIAWFCATCSSSAWNYLGLRYVVFPEQR